MRRWGVRIKSVVVVVVVGIVVDIVVNRRNHVTAEMTCYLCHGRQ